MKMIGKTLMGTTFLTTTAALCITAGGAGIASALPTGSADTGSFTGSATGSADALTAAVTPLCELTAALTQLITQMPPASTCG